jgi:hypothetical protein
MHPRIFEELARQHQADMRRRAAGRDCWSPARAITGPARGQRRSGNARVRANAGVSASACVSANARHGRHTRDASRSLRARTGWWLVDLGLRLAVRPDSHRAASPRPAGS